jgi:hypothetical protein
MNTVGGFEKETFEPPLLEFCIVVRASVDDATSQAPLPSSCTPVVISTAK